VALFHADVVLHRRWRDSRGEMRVRMAVPNLYFITNKHLHHGLDGR
jgi:hypothetical protein